MKEKKNQSTLKEMWKNPQKKALIKLGLWFAFFALTFIFLSIASLFNNNSNKNIDKKNYDITEEVVANIPKMLEKLISSNYTFEIKIINENNVEILNGSVKDKVETGYYEKENDIIKYSYHDGNYYILSQNNEIENNELIKEEYIYNISLSNIYNTIKTYEFSNEAIKNQNEYTYDISENNIIKINTNENNIEKINIFNNNISYELNFKVTD